MLTEGDYNHVDDAELYQGLDFPEQLHVIRTVCECVSYEFRTLIMLMFFILFFVLPASCRL